jgi:endonuclease YncB( thermonuclease family)
MRATVSVVMVAFVLALVSMRSWAGRATDDLVVVGTVTKIVDGDTIDVQLASGPIRVRIWGIDAPEHDQPYGAKAKELITKLVSGREVELQPEGQTTYNRMVARVFANGTDVDAELVKRGAAMAERRYLKQFPDGERYCELEDAARSARSGMWSLPSDQRIAPWQWRHKKNRTTQFTDYGKATIASCVAEIGKPLAP